MRMAGMRKALSLLVLATCMVTLCSCNGLLSPKKTATPTNSVVGLYVHADGYYIRLNADNTWEWTKAGLSSAGIYRTEPLISDTIYPAAAGRTFPASLTTKIYWGNKESDIWFVQYTSLIVLVSSSIGLPKMTQTYGWEIYTKQ